MAEEFVNRKNQRYYLLEGRTKTGKPKYYCSRKPVGTRVESMPEGYEWRENPRDAIVSVRKVRPTRIAAFEREELIRGIRELAGLKTFIVEIDGDSLVVYLCDRDPDMVAGFFGIIAGTSDVEAASFGDWARAHVHYTPMMRFVLEDADKRLYRVERWCFLGSIDDWIFLARPAHLAKQISTFAPHLGKESFYDLM